VVLTAEAASTVETLSTLTDVLDALSVSIRAWRTTRCARLTDVCTWYYRYQQTFVGSLYEYTLLYSHYFIALRSKNLRAKNKV